MKCNKTHKNITPVLPRSLETIKCLLSIFYGFFIKKIVKNSKIFIISLLKKNKNIKGNELRSKNPCPI